MQHRLSDNWVVTATYLGNATSHLWIGNEINPAVYIPGTCGSAACSSTSNTQSRRVLSLLNPKVGAYYSTMITADDGISSNYNGLLTSVEHRFAQNFTLLGNYTWSKCLGIAPVASLSGDVLQDPTTCAATTARAPTMHLIFSTCSVVYISRFRHGRVVSHVLSDWSISPLIRYTSGLPVNPATGKDNSLTGGGNDRPNVVAGVDAYTDAPHGLKYQYINPAAYVPNPIGTFGNAGHLSLRAPGSFNGMDAAVARQFKLREQLALTSARKRSTLSTTRGSTDRHERVLRQLSGRLPAPVLRVFCKDP